MEKKEHFVHRHGKRFWHFIWHEDSIWSWLANVIIAFMLIRFVVYPLLGVLLGTSFPIVAVVSESMEHGLHNEVLCGQKFDEFAESFDAYWNTCGKWYENMGITKSEFRKFPFDNGFNKGDVIILWRANAGNVDVGDILIFQGPKPQPIIHRVVKVTEKGGTFVYQTKGDHNSDSLGGAYGETEITLERVLGQGVVRLPYLGWIKILFVDAVKPLGIRIQR
ncbi:signal peptidase I [Candidatus Woesearchaeota archaeon]|nr:signal peptidase I [Candidatus Woesearchaeota archaeon]